MDKKLVPINRNSKFYGFEDFALEVAMGREFVEDDMDFRVIIYRVDHEKTNHDDLYGEVDATQIKYKSPIEVSCTVSLKPKTNKQYSPNGTLLREEWGNLIFNVYEDHLNELGIQINKGDYVAYPVREDYLKFFSVVDNDLVNDSTERLLGLKKGFYRKIECTPVDNSEFMAN